MQIRIQTQGFDLTPAIAAWTHERVAGALERFAHEVSSVDVYLKDINGPRGGDDKLALVRVQSRAAAPVFVESTHSDLYAAIDRSSQRVKRSFRRMLKRRHRLALNGSRRLRRIDAIMAEL